LPGFLNFLNFYPKIKAAKDAVVAATRVGFRADSALIMPISGSSLFKVILTL
jgi:hypothetical protein